MRTYGKILTGFSIIFLLCYSVQAADHGTISGRVTWKGGLGVVPGAAVYLYDISESKIDSAISDIQGAFSLNEPAGKYYISAEKDNLVKEYFPDAYLMSDAHKIIVSGGQNTQVLFALYAGGWISGTFAYEGENVPAGLITVIKIDQPHEGWYKSLTLDGPFPSAYAIQGLIPGIYKIMARARGKSTEYYPGVENIGDASAITVSPDLGVSNITFMLNQVGWGIIQGHVINQISSQGIADLPISAYQWRDFWQDPNLTNVRSNLDGSYQLNVPAGDYFIFTVYSVYSGASMALYYNNCYEPISANIIHVAAGQIVPSIDFVINFSVKHNLSISGSVINQRTGYGLNDVVVTAINSETGLQAGSAYSIGEGNFTINGLSGGRYLLMFSGTYIIPYFYSEAENWQDGDVIELGGHFDNVRTEAITQDYGNNGLSIAGTVTSPDGPLNGARIYAYPFGSPDPIAYARTDDFGSYSIVNGLVPGQYRITCDFVGYNHREYPNLIYLDLMSNPEASGIDFVLNGTTNISNDTAPLGGSITIGGNYPNPFNMATLIKVYSSRVEAVSSRLMVYNLLGQMISDKVVQIKPGNNGIEWNSNDYNSIISSGTYFYRFDGISASKRMILIK
jgi:hypothetical protein